LHVEGFWALPRVCFIRYRDVLRVSVAWGGERWLVIVAGVVGVVRERFSIWWWWRLEFVLLPEEVKLKSFFECVAVVGVAEFGWE
jgi:hypothetical protein